MVEKYYKLEDLKVEKNYVFNFLKGREKMNTLKKNFEFKRVLNRGKCINGKFLAIYIFPNKLNDLRVGFAIGKKAGKAHDRNRIRRIVRENYRLIEDKLVKGLDIVFVWKNLIPADKIEFNKIKEDVNLLVKFYGSKEE